jgi:hypothetical protein
MHHRLLGVAGADIGNPRWRGFHDDTALQRAARNAIQTARAHGEGCCGLYPPLYFPSGGQQLFGWLHRPPGPQTSGWGVDPRHHRRGGATETPDRRFSRVSAWIQAGCARAAGQKRHARSSEVPLNGQRLLISLQSDSEVVGAGEDQNRADRSRETLTGRHQRVLQREFHKPGMCGKSDLLAPIQPAREWAALLHDVRPLWASRLSRRAWPGLP